MIAAAGNEENVCCVEMHREEEGKNFAVFFLDY